MRLILSRKGLDSSFGRTPSPILPDGRLCWLPIPENNKSKPNLPSYGQLQYADRNLGELLEELSHGAIPPTTTVHLDPELSAHWLNHGDDWRPLFGQTGAPERHLRNEGVTTGDIFLFFGWFRQTEEGPHGLRFVPGAPDLHVIYGWMQIHQRCTNDLFNTWPETWKHHPHIQGASYGALDTLYTASETLSAIGRPDLPGAGLFSRIEPELVLTKPGSSRSQWLLVRDFFPQGRTPMSFHSDPTRWNVIDDRHVRLTVASRGQEFVLDLNHYPGVRTWLRQTVFTDAMKERDVRSS
jgi:Nucleotide modification associated domain 3